MLSFQVMIIILYYVPFHYPHIARTRKLFNSFFERNFPSILSKVFCCCRCYQAYYVLFLLFLIFNYLLCNSRNYIKFIDSNSFSSCSRLKFHYSQAFYCCTRILLLVYSQTVESILCFYTQKNFVILWSAISTFHDTTIKHFLHLSNGKIALLSTTALCESFDCWEWQWMGMKLFWI